jgi:alpha-tubulin suppressor-like RCC1 family protein
VSLSSPSRKPATNTANTGCSLGQRVLTRAQHEPSVKCWGVGGYGQLGLGEREARATSPDWGKIFQSDADSELPEFGSSPDTVGDAIPVLDFGGECVR